MVDEGCREEAYIWSLNRAKFMFLYYKQFLDKRCGMGLCVYCWFYKFQFLRYKTWLVEKSVSRFEDNGCAVQFSAEKCYYELLGRLLYDLTAWKHLEQ
jgi:hypothetical protein